MVQVAQEGEAVHIHSDSKATLQALKKFSGTGTYKSLRDTQHKALLTEIIDHIQTKHLCMILEWVKGHEDMAEEIHTWLSKLKKEGNEMADEEAKRATGEEEEASDFRLEEHISFRHQDTGIRYEGYTTMGKGTL